MKSGKPLESGPGEGMKQSDPLVQLSADCRIAEAGASQEAQRPLVAITVVWSRAAMNEMRIQGMCICSQVLC